MRNGGIPAVAAVVLSSMAGSVSAQADVELAPVELDSVMGFSAGAAAGVVAVAGEAFELVSTGYGVQLFVGLEWANVDEVRVGVALSTHADALTESNLRVATVYLKPHWALRLGRAKARLSPHVGWTIVSGAEIRELDGFGVGGSVGAQFRLSERISVEADLGMTMSSFPRPPGSSDPDRMAYGTLREFRIGTVYHIN